MRCQWHCIKVDTKMFRSSMLSGIYLIRLSGNLVGCAVSSTAKWDSARQNLQGSIPHQWSLRSADIYRPFHVILTLSYTHIRGPMGSLWEWANWSWALIHYVFSCASSSLTWTVHDQFCVKTQFCVPRLIMPTCRSNCRNKTVNLLWRCFDNYHCWSPVRFGYTNNISV